MHPRHACRLALLVGWLAIGRGAAALTDDAAVKDELKRHQGTWAVTSPPLISVPMRPL